MRTLCLIVTTCVSTVSTVAAAAPEPPSFRLPDTVRPLRYDLDLTLSPSQDGFTGTVAIDVELTSPTRVIWLQAEDLDVSQTTVRAGGETIAATASVAGRSWLGLSLARQIGPGKARLELRYA